MPESGAVRPMHESETERVLELWLDLVDHHRELDSSFPAPGRLLPSLRHELAQLRREPKSEVFVAHLGEQLVGFAVAQIESEPDPADGAGVCWIHELYVDPEARRRRLGIRLVERAEHFFSERGGSRVAVRVEAINREGLRFWQARGFAERARVLERLM